MQKNIAALIGSTLVLLSSTVFADEKVQPKQQMPPFEQGTELSSSQAVAGYNYPARVKTTEGWDTFVTASYTYWNVFQEGMEIGQLQDAQNVSDLNLGILEFSDEYKSGFKVGLGWNTPFDDWVVSAEYTWFHHSLYKNQPSSFVLSSSFLNVINNAGFLSSSHKWHIDLDVVDIMLGRPFYQGTRLTINPSFGLKGLVLNQKYTFEGPSIRRGDNATVASSNYGKTDSWAVGPSLRVNGDFLLGEGFRLMGGVSGTVTFTRYNGIQYFAFQPGSEESVGYLLNIRGSDENRVRAICDADAGLSWGMYLCNEKYHIDFSAVYEFQVFWNQNMINWYAQNLNNNNGYSPGNLYFQGLTVSATFDF